MLAAYRRQSSCSIFCAISHSMMAVIFSTKPRPRGSQHWSRICNSQKGRRRGNRKLSRLYQPRSIEILHQHCRWARAEGRWVHCWRRRRGTERRRPSMHQRGVRKHDWLCRPGMVPVLKRSNCGISWQLERTVSIKCSRGPRRLALPHQAIFRCTRNGAILVWKAMSPTTASVLTRTTIF